MSTVPLLLDRLIDDKAVCPPGNAPVAAARQPHAEPPDGGSGRIAGPVAGLTGVGLL